MVKNLLANVGDMGSIPESGRSLEKGMATHASILAWEIPWTEEPSGLQSMELQKSRTQLSDLKTTITVLAGRHVVQAGSRQGQQSVRSLLSYF